MCVCVQLGRTPLHCAAAGGHSFVIDTLLTAGAALELTDKVSCYSVISVKKLNSLKHLVRATVAESHK